MLFCNIRGFTTLSERLEVNATMLESLEGANRALPPSAGRIEICIGIHRGTAIVGNVGTPSASSSP